MTDRQYPVGKFSWPKNITAADRAKHIETIATSAAKLRSAAERLSTAQLDTPYREGGWTARQVLHHVPESHMNAYIRFKLALTEEQPVIKPYNEAAWAELSDVAIQPVDPSLRLLTALHERWVKSMEGLSESDWKRQFLHPEIGPMALDTQIAMYAWHCDHHLAHVKLIAGW
jgi:hypothetical protein